MKKGLKIFAIGGVVILVLVGGISFCSAALGPAPQGGSAEGFAMLFPLLALIFILIFLAMKKKAGCLVATATLIVVAIAAMLLISLLSM